MADEFNNTEQIGINAVQIIVTEKFRWIFREKTKKDIGIDAELETPNGLLIQVQIKTGVSHFKSLKNKPNALIYYLDQYHHDYWLKLNVPVLFIAHIPIPNKTYWQIINIENLIKTKKKWKLVIPLKNELIEDLKDEIVSLCVKREEIKIIAQPHFEEGRITYSSNVLNAEHLGGINSKASRDTLLEIERKANLLHRIFLQKGLINDNPRDYSLRLTLATLQIESSNISEASLELMELKRLLRKESSENLEFMSLMLWIDYYLKFIQFPIEDLIHRVNNTQLFFLYRIEFEGSQTEYFIPSLTFFYEGLEFNLEKNKDNLFLFSPIKENLPNFNFDQLSYQITIDVINDNKNNQEFIPSISKTNIKVSCGLSYQNEILKDFITEELEW